MRGIRVGVCVLVLVACEAEELRSDDGGAALDAPSVELDAPTGTRDGPAPMTDAPRRVDGGGPTVDGGPADHIRVVADGTGIQELWWDDVNLFAGVGGYYVIGSCTGADDMNNVTSQGSDGRTLRAPGVCAGAPFRMTISGEYPIRVSIEVGPLPADYRTLSVPLDPVKSFFEMFSFAGASYEVGCATSWSPRSGGSARYDSIPLPCTIPGVGGVGVARVRPVPAWGEITGPVATIRRTFLSGDAQELAFINHPGTNNIEPGFNADFSRVIAAGTTVRLEEEIWVTGPGTMWADRTSWTFEAESPAMGHSVGRPDADGWSANTTDDAAGALCFGPYARDLPAGNYEARFRMLVDNNTADSLVALRIDVNDYGTGAGCGDCVLAARDVRRTDFTAAAAYQDFTLAFTSPGVGHALEFRTSWEDRAYVREDRVEVVRLP